MPVRIIEDKKIFRLDTPRSTYLMQVSDGGYLLHLYYGATVSDDDLSDYIIRSGLGASFSPDSPSGRFSCDIAPFEYPANGTGDFRVSALQIRGADGTASTDIRYCDYSVSAGKPKLDGLPATYANSDADCDTLTVVCRDEHTGAKVELIYTAFSALDVITRSVRVTNEAERPFELERIYSLSLDLPTCGYDMTTLFGTWARERNPDKRPLEHGIQGIMSKRGSSGHHHNPFMALTASDSGEEFGDAYGFSFVYSGNFDITCEVTAFDTARVIVGINPSDFGWKLEKGETFQSPEAVMVFSCKGQGEMSRTFHKLYRCNLCRGEWKEKERPILVNNWEATYFGFDDDKLVSIARDAKELGIEMLVMDDGWFGGRDDDRSSLGDWFVNEKKLKGGLGSLVKRVNELGLKFGIWFEPEMISPVSRLYDAHPDWVLSIPGRDRSIARSQYVLDMSRADVRDYLFERMSDILRSANIEYVKWDFNRNLTELGSLLLPPDRQREVCHRYVLGLYELLERLLAKFPHLLLEGCSGGGGRFDPGMLYYSPQIWTSDDSEAIERLDIQWGTLMVYPSSSMSAHVSAVPNHQLGRVTSFETRGNVAMAGAFGYELDLNKLTDKERETVKRQVADYHRYYNVVQNGDYYRLISPFENRYHCAWEYVSADKSECLFTFVVMRARVHYPTYVRLRGLDPEKKYRDGSTGKVYFGDTLMSAGLCLGHGQKDFDSVVKYFTEVK